MEKPIVNYVWMQFEKGRTHPIPSHLFYNVQENAKQYPRIKFIVWVQNQATIGTYRIPKNVEIRTPESIPGFSDTPIMNLYGKQYDWAKVDFARLFIIRHILENERRTVLYSDMDVRDIRIHAPSLRSRLTKYGVALGATYSGPEPDTKLIVSRYENGYMAFTESGKDLLERIIQTCERVVPKREGFRDTVYDAQFSAIEQWADEKRVPDWERNVASFPVQPPCYCKQNTIPQAELR